jgi:predicted aspartyl protease
LSIAGVSIPFDGLIDSGADECTFPGWIVKSAGRNVHRGKKRIFSGIGGSVLAYLHRTTISLENARLLADVYCSHEWDTMPFGLLGQAGFFSRFDIRFRYSKKTIVLAG